MLTKSQLALKHGGSRSNINGHRIYGVSTPKLVSTQPDPEVLAFVKLKGQILGWSKGFSSKSLSKKTLADLLGSDMYNGEKPGC